MFSVREGKKKWREREKQERKRVVPKPTRGSDSNKRV